MDNAQYKPDGRKRYTTWWWCGSLYLVTWYCSADEINLYSINTGSYVYHLTHNHGQYTENFENNFISVERKFSDDSKYSFVLGTMKNSFDDRCLAAGVRRDWAGWDNGWVFKGIYGYVGEKKTTSTLTIGDTQALRGRLCCQTPVDNILTGFESVNFIQREKLAVIRIP